MILVAGRRLRGVEKHWHPSRREDMKIAPDEIRGKRSSSDSAPRRVATNVPLFRAFIVRLPWKPPKDALMTVENHHAAE
jgi:hypothetical protein